jgi:hypothetical protein
MTSSMIPLTSTMAGTQNWTSVSIALTVCDPCMGGIIQPFRGLRQGSPARNYITDYVGYSSDPIEFMSSVEWV